jgi:hypothetical protein
MLKHGNRDYPGLIAFYAKISRMRVLSSGGIVGKAVRVAQKIMDAYSEPDKSFADLREMAKGNSIDLLHDFSGHSGSEPVGLGRVLVDICKPAQRGAEQLA